LVQAMSDYPYPKLVVEGECAVCEGPIHPESDLHRGCAIGFRIGYDAGLKAEYEDEVLSDLLDLTNRSRNLLFKVGLGRE